MAPKAIAKVFMSGRSQAVRLPKAFRFQTKTVLVHRKGNALILEAVDTWPEGYFASMGTLPSDVRRPAQGKLKKRPVL